MKYPRYQKYRDTGIEWLGQIPEHWSVVPLFTELTERDIRNTGNIVSDVLSLSYGRIIPRDVETNMGLLPASFETYQIVDPGNLILRLTDLQNDKRSLRVGLVKQRGIITSAYVGLESSGSLNPEYAYYLLHGYDLLKVFYAQGGGVRQSMKYSDLKRLPLVLPPPQERVLISGFLESETAQIDTLIAKQQQLIELLQEKRQALISHAVTKGLNPAAPMKDSGIEWLGEIPAHWGISGFTKYLNIVDYRGRTPRKVDSGMYLVTARNIKGGKIDYSLSTEYVDPEDAESLLNRGRPEAGDVLMTTEAPLGEVANVDRTDFALAQRIIKLRGVSQILDNYYLKYWIMSTYFQQHLATLATGSTALGIKGARLHMLKTLLPPISEQEEIVEYIGTEIKRIDSIVARSVKAIELLQERRTALISAAVTGKIDVRSLVN